MAPGLPEFREHLDNALDHVLVLDSPVRNRE